MGLIFLVLCALALSFVSGLACADAQKPAGPGLKLWLTLLGLLVIVGCVRLRDDLISSAQVSTTLRRLDGILDSRLEWCTPCPSAPESPTVIVAAP